MATSVAHTAWVGDKHQCARCLRSFKRVEHLKRHERSHGNGKQFICSVCSKGFERRDILQRHEFTHRLSLDGSAGTRKGRACIECAKAREKCSKGQPCSRCSTRSLQCSYPKESSREIQAQNQLQDHDDLIGLSHGVQASLQSSTLDAPFTRYGLNERDPFFSSGSPTRSPLLDDTVEGGQQLQSPYMITEAFSSPTDYAAANNTVPMTRQAAEYGNIADYPLNWLPVNDCISIDYSSILGLDLNSYGTFIDGPLAGAAQAPFSAPNQSSQMDNHQAFEGSAQVDTLNFEQATPLPGSLAVTSPSGTTSTQLQSSGVSTTNARLGDLYATSTDGARIPCTTRSKRTTRRLPGTLPTKSVLDVDAMLDEGRLTFIPLQGLSFSPLEDASLDKITLGINESTYFVIVANFRQLCLNHDHYEPYIDDHIPTRSQFNFFIQLYFQHFDQILPIIHTGSSQLNTYWPLALAVSAIGCQYVGAQEATRCVRSLHEFVRRALVPELEIGDRGGNGTALTQALILNQVGLLYCGLPGCYQQARMRHGTILELAHSLELFVPAADLISEPDVFKRTQKRWKAWSITEGRRRLRYAIWLLDCMMTYQSGQKSILPLDLANLPLPDDNLWACKTAEEWLHVFEKSEVNPLLSEGVSSLFLAKQVKKDLGEFSRILLLHGVYEEIFKVRGFLNRPLSSWVPSIQWRPGPTVRQDSQEPSCSSQESLRNWRNAALDCVDVLHWAANATIASAAGLEHATVLHLHMSRVILLAPYDSIRTLANSIASLEPQFRWRGTSVPHAEAMVAERKVLDWAQRDEHKARLAALHCGCFYWHIRRYSRDAFYEPISVLLATLTLWAYSSYVLRASPSNKRMSIQTNLEGARSGSVTRPTTPTSNTIREMSSIDQEHAMADDGENREPTFIRLDRPNDDELVQLYVRSGRPSVMRAYITGVGNICSPQGPIKILKEGREILGSVSSAWGRTQEYVSLLSAMEKMLIKK